MPSAAYARIDPFASLEAGYVAQLNVDGCVVRATQSCKVAALLFPPPPPGGLCVADAVATQSYRLPDRPPFRAIELIVQAKPSSTARADAAPAFFKAIVPMESGENRTACLPRLATTNMGTFEIALWSDPEGPGDDQLVPVDSISPYSARLSGMRGKDAKGILDILFGPSFSGNSIALTITSSGAPRRVALPDGQIRTTATGVRISANAIERIRVQFDKSWRSLLACGLEPSSRRWVRTYRC